MLKIHVAVRLPCRPEQFSKLHYSVKKGSYVHICHHKAKFLKATYKINLLAIIYVIAMYVHMYVNCKLYTVHTYKALYA